MAKRVKKNPFNKILSYILIIMTTITLALLLKTSILPMKILIIVFGIFFLLLLYLIIKINNHQKSKTLAYFLSLLVLFIELILIVFLYGTIDFLNKIVDTGYRVDTYSIYVLKESKVNSIKDLDDITIYQEKSSASNNNALSWLKNHFSNEIVKEEKLSKVFDNLENKKTKAIFINEEVANTYLEENPLELNQLKSVNITYKNNSDFKSVNVTKKPFAIYISGIDTTGKINKSARSDVNILAVINPNDNKILLINTPRDYYLKLSTKNSYDKLTHAGIYGVEESAKSLGLLYDTDINYYIRLNFTSFIQIIDDLNGIEVDVEKPDYRFNGEIDCGLGYLCEQNSKREFDNKMIKIKYGKQALNGEQALAYARNRHQYASGDLKRGTHQQEIIKAVIEKITNLNNISKFNTILKRLSTSTMTNMKQKEITELINYQIKKNPNWSIESISVKGTDSYNQCYSTGSSNAYVIIPDEESLNEAKEAIKNIIK